MRKNIQDDGVFSVLTDGNISGWFIRKNYIGYISEEKGNINIYILSTQEVYDSLIENRSIEKQETDYCMNLYEKGPVYKDIYYHTRKFNFNQIEKENQTKYIDKMEQLFRSRNSFTVLWCGKPGTGKTTTSLLLAKRLKSSYTNSFNPTSPGDIFAFLYSRAGPSKKSPLIVCLDEFDKTCEKVHNGSIKRHDGVITQIYDKSSMNSFFDWIDRGLYPFTIFILISNKPPSYFDDLDPSYLREGRVHLRIDETDN